MNISQIALELRQEIDAGSNLFVLTDERDRSFFEPLTKSFRLLFLGDFSEVIGDTSKLDGAPFLDHVVPRLTGFSRQKIRTTFH